MSYYRAVGADLESGDRFTVLSGDAKPTITGSIRCGLLPRDAKKRYAYLEIQEVDGDEYEVVDGWSHPLYS